jgi:IS30 family transposase
MKTKRKYKHLSFEERFVIEKLLKAELKIRSIADFLDRSPNTISYEIKNNSVNGEYIAKKANHRAYVKRWRSKRQCLKVSMDRFLIKFVEKKLREKWSPKQISGHLSVKYNISCSDKAIYKFVKSRSLERFLFWSWNNKKSGRKRYQYDNPKDDRKYIDVRPLSLETGHFEADFIVSKWNTYSLLVVTDRLTKYTDIRLIPNRKHETVSRAFQSIFSEKVVKTLTLDNDISFNHWKQLERQLKTTIYFTHPYHSWEKGLVENTNRWIRCFVPKRRDISSVTNEEIQEILSFINDRPREIIGFRKPLEYYLELSSVLLRG